MGLPAANGAVVGAILEGVEAKWRSGSVRPRHVHCPIDDVTTKVLEVQPHMGQVSGFGFPQLKEDAIEKARGHLRVLPIVAYIQRPT